MTGREAARGGKKVERIRRSYRFFAEREAAGATFTAEEIESATGWKPGTISTYFKKKWSSVVVSTRRGLRASGIGSYTEDEYVRLMSQRDAVSADPRRPELQPEVEALVRKARESALLALQVYNCPTTVFRTEGYTVLMVIAWTSLFHAVFELRGTDYFYVDDDGNPRMVDGDKKAWELDKCMDEFWGKSAVHAVRKNLEFFIKLRNRVVHRYVPPLDPHVAGECQALLFNFDEMLVAQFGSYFAIRESLAVPLQTSNLRTDSHNVALRKLQANHFDDVKHFVDAFREQIGDELYQDPKFSFRVYLVPKVGNHAESSDMAFEFVQYDPSRAEEMAKLEKQIVMVRQKQVVVADPSDLMKPKDVVMAVAAKLKRKFTMHHHTLAWKRYSVRQSGFSKEGCNPKYCVPSTLYQSYGYTKAWVSFLVVKLSDPVEYEALIATGRPQEDATS